MAIKSLARSSILQPQETRFALAGYQTNMFHHLETVRLSSSASTVEFTNLNQYSDYQHLQVRYVVRSGLADVVDELFIYLNGDTGSNYANHYLRSNGSAVQSNAFTSYSKLYDAGNTITGASAPANSFGVGVLDILDPFETTKYTTTRTLGGSPYSAAGYVALNSGLWMNTAALTSIEFDLPSSTFVSGSRFSLYGLKVRA